MIFQGAEAVFGRKKMKVDRIDEQTSWWCLKSSVMFDNIGKSDRRTMSRVLEVSWNRPVWAAYHRVFVGTIKSVKGLGSKNYE